MYSIKCIQSNLNKSLTSATELIETLSRDLYLVQEPPCINGVIIPNFHHPHRIIYHSPLSRPYTAIICANPNLNLQLLTDFSNNKFTTVVAHFNRSKVVLVSAYVHPHDDDARFSNFITELCEHPLWGVLPIIFAGDFNARSTFWYDRITTNRGSKLLELIQDLDLTCHNNSSTPTCIHATGSSNIDLTLSRNLSDLSINNWVVNQERLSCTDHRTIDFCMTMQANEVQDTTHFTTRRFVENEFSDWERFASLVDSDCLSRAEQQLSNLVSPSAIDQAVVTLTQVLIRAADQSLAPIRHGSINTRAKWFSPELCNMKITLSVKRRYYERCTDPIIKPILKHAYSVYRNAYSRAIRRCKATHIKNFLSDVLCNNLWKHNTFKCLRNKLTPKSSNITILDFAGTELVSKHTELVNELFPDDDRSTDSSTASSTREYIPRLRNQSVIVFNELDVEEIVTKLVNKKTPGLDHISNRMIKWSLIKSLPLLLKILNSCLQLGYFPCAWKTSAVIIIPKPNRAYQCAKDFRPICLISGFSKILEKLIANKLNCFLRTSNFYSTAQHGFCKGKSTITALQEIFSSIIEHKKRTHTALVSIDFKGAFDNMWPPGLIKHLDSLEAPAQLINIVHSFLSNRTLVSQYKRSCVRKFSTKGAPQGSALSPTLWNIHLNALLCQLDLHSTKVVSFADDVSIVVWDKSPTQLSARITRIFDIISKWCVDNKLELSLSKSNILMFSNISVPPCFVNGQPVEVVQKTKVLGVTVANSRWKKKLNFAWHIEAINNKATRLKTIMYSIMRNTWGLPNKLKLLLYKAALRPAICYASEVWYDHLNKKQKSKLNSIQRAFVIRCISAYRTVSFSNSNFLANMEQIDCFIEIKTAKFRFKHNIQVSNEIEQITGIPIAALDFDMLNSVLREYKKNKMSISYRNCSEHLKLFFPTSPVPKHISPDFFTTQIFTGHGCFRSYLHRMHIVDSATCPCDNQSTQTVHHVMFTCRKVGGTFGPPPLHLNQLINSPSRYSAFKIKCKSLIHSVIKMNEHFNN